MHLSDDVLLAYLDHELDDPSAERVALHLKQCDRCVKALERVNQDREMTFQLLDQLNHPPLRITAEQGLRHFETQKENRTMRKHWYQNPALLGLVAVAVLATSLLFPPVRAFASDFLSLFRVEQVKVISFDPSNLAALENQEQTIENIFKDTVQVTKQGEFQEVQTLNEAQLQAGFLPRLPEDTQFASLGILPAQEISMTIETELWNALLENTGQSEARLDEALDGSKIVVQIPAVVSTALGKCEEVENTEAAKVELPNLGDCTILVQVPSPTISAPDGLKIDLLAEAGLRILGYSAEQAQEISAATDWTTTMVIPVPSGEGVTHTDVNVDQSSGTLVYSAEENGYTLFWTRNGMLYALMGSGDGSNAVDIANSLAD